MSRELWTRGHRLRADPSAILFSHPAPSPQGEGNKDQGRQKAAFYQDWRARRDLNPRPSAPEADALSAELRARCPELPHDTAVRILNYISVPKRTQQTRRSTGVIGFRNATLVDLRVCCVRFGTLI